MEANELRNCIFSFLAGAAVGAFGGHIITKKTCEQRQQETIDDVTEVYRKKLKELKEKGVQANESEKTEKEIATDDNVSEEDVKIINKPSISEMASFVNSGNHNVDYHSKYNYGQLKEAIKKTKEPENDDSVEDDFLGSFSPVSVVKDPTKIEILVSEKYGYYDKDYIYYVEEDIWRDLDSDVEYEEEDLPFDHELVDWDENDQCYIVDKTNHSIYSLERK